MKSDSTGVSPNIDTDPMAIAISKLDSRDVPAVDRLMKLNSDTLGFLPEIALREYIERGGCLGAKGEDGQLIGYLLYAAYRDYIRIAHLCVSAGFRAHGIARTLVEELRKRVTTQKVLRLHCRRDFAATDVWRKLGFVAVGERRGRSQSGAPLTCWCLTTALDEQLGLFQARVSEDALDVVIDAQIFFDFDEPDSVKTQQSKALLSDFLVDSLRLWITDELFNEIDRNDAPRQRELSRRKAQGYSQVAPPPDRIARFDRALRELLPSSRPSQESDIRQLAKTAASDINAFITRDRALLNKAEQITSLTDLRVLSPTDLIVQLHELSDGESYLPNRVSGVGLRWQRLTASDRVLLSFDSFLDHGERQSKLREKLDSLIATPDDRKCELLLSGDDIVAIGRSRRTWREWRDLTIQSSLTLSSRRYRRHRCEAQLRHRDRSARSFQFQLDTRPPGDGFHPTQRRFGAVLLFGLPRSKQDDFGNFEAVPRVCARISKQVRSGA